MHLVCTSHACRMSTSSAASHALPCPTASPNSHRHHLLPCPTPLASRSCDGVWMPGLEFVNARGFSQDRPVRYRVALPSDEEHGGTAPQDTVLWWVEPCLPLLRFTHPPLRLCPCPAPAAATWCAAFALPPASRWYDWVGFVCMMCNWAAANAGGLMFWGISTLPCRWVVPASGGHCSGSLLLCARVQRC